MTMLTTISSRGQVVLPKKIRLELNLTKGMQFLVLSEEGNILLMPIKMPSHTEYSRLLERARSWAKVVGMTEESIADAVKAVRAGSK